jgi:hypothetical protein
MRYVLYEGQGGDMLFTREDKVIGNPSLLLPFENKTPTTVIEADSDNDAIAKLNEFMIARVIEKKQTSPF